MALRCVIFRGLVREAEEDINKYLSSHEVRVLHMSQSETGDHISIALVVDDPDALPEEGL